MCSVWGKKRRRHRGKFICVCAEEAALPTILASHVNNNHNVAGLQIYLQSSNVIFCIITAFVYTLKHTVNSIMRDMQVTSAMVRLDKSEGLSKFEVTPGDGWRAGTLPERPSMVR